ncbi:MAG: hypothetical protein M3P49_17675 [Actinomycetota bacterium]|nr:hypothetical protein [Actinomycetota bacterium]
MESSDGTVTSGLAYFEDGQDFLGPRGETSYYRDHLGSLPPLLQEEGLTEAITVTTRCRDLAGESDETVGRLLTGAAEGFHVEGAADASLKQSLVAAS